MRNTLARKLEGFEALTEHDRWALNGLVPRIRQIGAHVDLIREGEVPENVQPHPRRLRLPLQGPP